MLNDMRFAADEFKHELSHHHSGMGAIVTYRLLINKLVPAYSLEKLFFFVCGPG